MENFLSREPSCTCGVLPKDELCRTQNPSGPRSTWGVEPFPGIGTSYRQEILPQETDFHQE